MGREDVTDFAVVDRTADPGFYRRFLDCGNALEDIRSSKAIILDGLALRPGMTVLDVGCGLGDDVRTLAARVAPDGRAFGVDASAGMVEEARRRLADQSNVELAVGDAQGLEFEDQRFDGVRAERVLMHVPNAGRALDEMVRVTRRGGRISVFDFDWDTFMIDSPDRELTRTVVRSFSDHMRSGWIGRSLPRLFRARGMVDVTVVPHVVRVPFDFFELLVGGHLTRLRDAGAVEPQALERWSTVLADRARSGEFFAASVALIVFGCRP